MRHFRSFGLPVTVQIQLIHRKLSKKLENFDCKKMFICMRNQQQSFLFTIPLLSDIDKVKVIEVKKGTLIFFIFSYVFGRFFGRNCNNWKLFLKTVARNFYWKVNQIWICEVWFLFQTWVFNISVVVCCRKMMESQKFRFLWYQLNPAIYFFKFQSWNKL